MRWKRIVEGVVWAAVVPAVLIAVSHPDVGDLALGAFGPPAATTLTRWLLIGSVSAVAFAAWRRSRRVAVLAVSALAALGVVASRRRCVSTHDVTFPGVDLTIAATVYEPCTPGPHAAAVLVPGSAPVRRGFYSLWADRLVRSGVVVLVPDKRGVGGTGGTFERNNNGSRANLDRLAADAASSLEFAAHLPPVDTTRLGLFGLSQAGWVAPIAAARSPRARFLLLITAPAVSVREEGVWSRMRGDEERTPTYSTTAAEQVMDTLTAGGVDARVSLSTLDIPGLWLFGQDDNSIPTRKSVAALDALRREGKPFEAVTFPSARHLLITRERLALPHVAPSSWRTIDQWVATRLAAGATVSRTRRLTKRGS